MEPDSQPVSEAVLRRYLLGELSGDELDGLEEQIFSNEQCVEQLSLVEDDLIDAFVRGELPDPEREHFEAHFLSSPRRRERVALTRGWLVPIQTMGRPAEPTEEPARPASVTVMTPRGRKPVSAWIFGPWAALPAAAVVLVMATAGLMNRFNQNTALRKQIEELRSQVAARPSSTDSQKNTELLAEVRREIQRELQGFGGAAGAGTPPLSFVLTPGVQRGANRREQRLVIPPGGNSIELSLALTHTTAYRSYRVVLQDPDGKEVWGKSQILASKEGADRSLKVVVPANVLRDGEYKALITGVTAAGEVEDVDDYYAFTITSK
jgi:anti-sigma factor RsiW